MLVVGAVLALVAACTSDGTDGGGSASTSVVGSQDEVPEVTVPEGFVPRDTRDVALTPFASRPRSAPPAVAVAGGQATLAGVVRGPDGPVPGATVLLERFEGDRSGARTVATGADGRFQASGLVGGRYRVRAWLAPSLTATQSTVAFVPGDGAVQVAVDLQRFGELSFQADLNVTGLTVGDTARVRGLLVRQAVDAQGIVIGTPQAGVQVRLDLGPGLALEPGIDPLSSTNADGLVAWPVRCTQPGRATASLSSALVNASAVIPACAAPAPTTTAPPPSSTTTSTAPPRAGAGPR